MSSQPAPVPLRTAFQAELDQLRMQVELMGVRVDQNLELMRTALVSGDERLLERALASDDQIDAMHVSLLERCYQLLNREAPVASDLRFVVSVVRILSEFERVGDLALRVIKLTPRVGELSTCGAPWDIALTMVDPGPPPGHAARRSPAAGRDLPRATADRAPAPAGARLGGDGDGRLHHRPGGRPHRRPRRHHRSSPPLPAHG